MKMPKISVDSPITNSEIPVVDLTHKRNISSSLSQLPQNGVLKLLAYSKYPNKNFPEGRKQFSIFLRNN